MRVNDKILSIPPYLSTSWRNVMSLHVHESLLVVMLRDGHAVSIPGLTASDIDKIFKAHEAYMENETAPAAPQRGPLGNLFSHLGFPEGSIQIGFSGLDQLGGLFQHNPALENSPPLPQEILHKIITVAKMMAADNNLVLPKPEFNCQCFHCQVARAVQQAIYPQEDFVEAEVDVEDDDLQFSQWSIKSSGENLYMVCNKLDMAEQYTVFLGKPVGCTCGKAGCEHVLAVLRS